MKKAPILKLFSLVAFAAAGAFAVANVKSSKKSESVKAVDYPTTKLYFLQNWNPEMGNDPTVWWWGGDHPSTGDYSSRPTMTWVQDTYNADSVSGKLWTYDLPSDCTNLKIQDNYKELEIYFGGAFSNFNNNALRFDYNDTDHDHLKPFNLTYVDDGAYLRGDWTNGWSIEGQLKMTGSSPYSITGVNLSGGSAVKMVYMENGAESYWGQFNSVSSTDDVRYPVKEVEDSEHNVNAGVVSTGTYNITVTYVSDGKWDYLFEGTANSDLDAACAFARNFVTNIKANCPYNYDDKEYNDGKSASTLASAWGSEISTYGGLDPLVKSYLTNKDSSVTDITTMFGVYDYVYGHYASVRALSGADFLGRTPAVVASSNSVVSPASETSNLIVIVSIVSLISASTLIGLIVIKRRRGIAK